MGRCRDLRSRLCAHRWNLHQHDLIAAHAVMRRLRRASLLVAFSLLASAATAQERIIGKPEADMIFAFSRAEWERYVGQFAAPDGWTVRLLPHDTGTALGRFNQSTGTGAFIHPRFRDEHGPPEVLIVGRYYPRRVMTITDELVKQIEQAAQLDLGPMYSVLANRAKVPGTE